MLTHVLYIDDSGTKEYAATPEEYETRRGKSRYFCFCGALMTIAEAGRLSNKLINLKLNRFGDETVEMKSNWLRIPQERQQRYLDSYGLTADGLNQFVSDYYDIVINESPLKFIAAIVDKLHMQQDYGNPWYAPAIAYELVLQRVQQELSSTDSVAVIIDDMTGATPKGNQYKANLKAQHTRLKRHGGQLRDFDFPCLATQKFVNSASSQILQVADLAAYNVHRQFMDYGEQWESHGPLRVYLPFGRIARKFRMDSNGRIQGFGIAKFPLRNRVLWTIDPSESRRAAP